MSYRWLISVALAIVAAGCGGAVAPAMDLESGVQATLLTGRRSDGREWSARYYFDRGALADSVLSGERVIALTASGNLLAIDAGTLSIVFELVPPVRATCLSGRPDGTVVIGFADGAISALSVPEFELTPLASVRGRPAWVGEIGGRLASCVWRADPAASSQEERGGDSLKFQFVGEDDEAPASLPSWDLAARCFFTDSRGRLFVGEDHGEFGAICSRFDPKSGDVVTWEKWPGGINGFVEDVSGQVFAFGGLMHMGFRFGFIAEVTGDTPRPIGLFTEKTGYLEGEWGEAERTDGPAWPIAAILPRAGGWLILAGPELSRVSSDFMTWEAVGEIRPRANTGHVASVGFRIPLVGLHRRSDLMLLYTSARDGLGIVDPNSGEATFKPGPPQLELREPLPIHSAYGQAVITDRYGDIDPWILTGGRFRQHPVFPEGEEIGQVWHRLVVPAPGGGTMSAWGDFTDCTTAWWEGSRLVSWEDREGVSADGLCVRPDGKLLVAEDGARVITGPGDLWCAVTGSPWGTGSIAGLARTPRVAADRPLTVRDAAWLDEGSLLLATKSGLVRWWIDGPAHGEPFPLKLSEGELIHHLCRDGRGRLWLAGRKLWLLEKSGARLLGGDEIPLLTAPGICTLAPDPDDPAAVLIGFESRGLLQLSLR